MVCSSSNPSFFKSPFECTSFVGADLSVLNLVIIKKGEQEIAGVTDSSTPRRLGPKRANKIRKLFNLDKSADVRKYVISNEINFDYNYGNLMKDMFEIIFSSKIQDSMKKMILLIKVVGVMVAYYLLLFLFMHYSLLCTIFI
jgi:hypothetical protein